MKNGINRLLIRQISEVIQMTCPRCGEKIDGNPCSNRGFPETLRWKKWSLALAFCLIDN